MKNYDVVISGFGLVGALAAIALSKMGLSVAVFEKSSIEKKFKIFSDGRSSAISYASSKILDKYGLWQNIDNIGLIEEIRVTDNDSVQYLHFGNLIDERLPLGYMVENFAMLNNLYKSTLGCPNVDLLTEKEITGIENGPDYVVIKHQDGSYKTKLLIAADGKKSKIRELASINRFEKDYNQTAIVCTILHEKNHQNIAQEKFYPSGPFAILPLKGGYSSSIVWVEKPEIAAIYAKLDKKDLVEYMKNKFGDYLGEIKIGTEVFFYPLSMGFAQNYYKGRVVLIGDAAHSVHPLAGQGYNLGIEDVEELVNNITENAKLGLDIGSVLVLDKYEKARKSNNLIMMAVTDGFNSLFSNDNKMLSLIRKTGLASVDLMPKLKELFAKYAMGL